MNCNVIQLRQLDILTGRSDYSLCSVHLGLQVVVYDGMYRGLDAVRAEEQVSRHLSVS